ncbi:MAG: hypothetical protein HY048_10060 [Acidobacteria bacterium]|nr:hypothetical protein [Acidobacteriota bacterium]
MTRAHAPGEFIAPPLLVAGWLSRSLAVLTVCVVLVPAPAFAVTVDQVVELSKAGVSDAVILALIDRDRTVFSIDPDQIVTLHRDGLTDRVIVAMLKSGRQEGEDAAREASASNAARIEAALSSVPEVAFVGHGPDVPNTTHSSNFSDPLTPGPIAIPYLAPYLAPSLHRRPATPSSRARAFQPAPLCLAQVTAAGSASSFTLITPCPAAMQRSPAR